VENYESGGQEFESLRARHFQHFPWILHGISTGRDAGRRAFEACLRQAAQTPSIHFTDSRPTIGVAPIAARTHGRRAAAALHSVLRLDLSRNLKTEAS
jgi:hypothetical protein